MKLNQFVSKTELLSKTEIEKVRFLGYYFLRQDELNEFTTKDISNWFQLLNLPSPNQTRLKNNLRKSRKFIRGSSDVSFCLHAKEISELDALYFEQFHNSEEIIASDTILPATLFLRTRGYIEILAKQINASFESNIFDGCAVLMRRLIEILLILSYIHHSMESRIQNSTGEFKSLSKIIGDAKTNRTLGLSKGTKECIDEFRVLGNFSAHRIEYNCKRPDIENIRLDYRAAIEELLYKAGIKN